MKRPRVGHILSAGDPQPGDQAPDGYLQWHAWAEVQHKAGLRQKECGKCGRWKYPQELSGEEVSCTGITSRGKKRVITMPVCNGCATEPAGRALLAEGGGMIETREPSHREMAMLIRMLLKSVPPEKHAHQIAVAYLERFGLTGEPLRVSALLAEARDGE